MLNIAICDDDIQTTGRMDMLLQEIAKRNFMDVEIEVFWNGESLADAVAQGTYFDMIYLDIEMDKEDGISAAKRIRTYDKNALIIYVTSHENHMQESFEVRPFRFIRKNHFLEELAPLTRDLIYEMTRNEEKAITIEEEKSVLLRVR